MKNVVINEHTKRKCSLALFTLETVEENQELHFSYFGSLDDVRVNTLTIHRRTVLPLTCVPQVTRIEAREDIANGECHCGAKNCIGTLFPRIIRSGQESGDEGGNEEEVHDEEGENEGSGGEADKGDDGMADERVEADTGDDMHMDV